MIQHKKSKLGEWDVWIYHEDGAVLFYDVYVPSKTQEDLVYNVLIEGDKVDCSCKSYIYRQQCAHCNEVKQYVATKS